MLKNKKRIYTFIGIFALIIILGGIAYAWFVYQYQGSDHQILVGDIYLVMEGNSNSLNISNIYPQSAIEARSRNDNYVTFEVSGLNEVNKDIYYAIDLVYGNTEASPKVRFNDEDLRFDLVELDSNNNEVTYLLSEVSYDSLVNQRIYVNKVVANTSSEVSKKYKVRMWLTDEVLISDSDSNADYPATGFSNYYASIKVAVVGDFLEKEASVQAYNFIENLASSKAYIASYDDIITQNPTFTTQDQVSTNATKQTVYYYTGDNAAANANVLFAGYCWQIIRTTDNGGVRMIYNGVAQKTVTESTPISNTDITYTNDGTYAYTYDSTTKKWTSANAGQASTTDTFIFSVNTAGDYAINYKLSSEFAYDLAKIYKNNVLIGSYSGDEESIIDLETLATTDTIKIEYTKNASTDTGTDNVIFSIESITSRSENPVCVKGRTATKGINQASIVTTQDMSTASLYGRSFDYDLATGEFTLQETNNLPTAWTTSDANNNGIEDYKELIGTYTCLSNLNTCSMLYYVGSINESDTAQAYVSKYTIGYVAHFSQMGKSAFNPNEYSPAMVGYMFNTEYDKNSDSKEGAYYTTAVWENNTYTLSNSNNGTEPDVEHHYICDTDCTKVRYYYYVSGSSHYYILLENGMTIEDAIYQMTGYGTTVTKNKAINANYELNNYNSSMKGYLDNWYKKNLTGYTSYLDSTSVYCNDRSISELGGWNPTAAPSLTTPLQFYQYNTNRDLNCANETDRFAVTNSKAELSFPIGLLTEPERNLMTDNFAKISQSYWLASPYNMGYNDTYVSDVYNTGGHAGHAVRNRYGVRGVISLKPGIMFESGTGTYTDPYIVGPIVDRNS